MYNLYILDKTFSLIQEHKYSNLKLGLHGYKELLLNAGYLCHISDKSVSPIYIAIADYIYILSTITDINFLLESPIWSMQIVSLTRRNAIMDWDSPFGFYYTLTDIKNIGESININVELEDAKSIASHYESASVGNDYDSRNLIEIEVKKFYGIS